MPNIEAGQEKDTENRVYELGYLLIPKIKEEDLTVMYGNLKDLVSNLGGEYISDEMPKNIPLAYTISKILSNKREKFDTAYFGWIKFYMNPEKVSELKKNLDQDQNYLRFLIIKTVKENTLATKRFIGRDSVRRRSSINKKEGEEVPVFNKEEVDKEIEAMVAL